MSSTAYILGAGFSKAVDRRMPTLLELSESVVEVLDDKWRDEWGPELRDNVELLLSYLVAENPWERRDEHHSLMALYYEVVSILTGRIQLTEQAVRETGEPPPWLVELVLSWHAASSTVITFNFDTLVEHALGHAQPIEKIGGEDAYAVPLPWIGTRRLTIWSYETIETLRLLKLHGSINWWYSGPDAPPGDVVYVEDGMQGWRDEKREDFEPVFYTRDKTPLVVPPTLQKTNFYRNNVLRAQWEQARQAIAEADRIVLLGYSIPMSDVTSRMLISTARRGGLIEVVDLDPGAGAKIQAVLPGFDVTQLTSGTDAVADYVERLVGTGRDPLR